MGRFAVISKYVFFQLSFNVLRGDVKIHWSPAASVFSSQLQDNLYEIYRKLNFEKFIINTVSKARGRLVTLARLRKTLDLYTTLTIYKQTILPILDYCCNSCRVKYTE